MGWGKWTHRDKRTEEPFHPLGEKGPGETAKLGLVHKIQWQSASCFTPQRQKSRGAVRTQRGKAALGIEAGGAFKRFRKCLEP